MIKPGILILCNIWNLLQLPKIGLCFIITQEKDRTIRGSFIESNKYYKGREIKPIGLDFDDLNLIMDPACFEKHDTHQGNQNCQTNEETCVRGGRSFQAVQNRDVDVFL